MFISVRRLPLLLSCCMGAMSLLVLSAPASSAGVSDDTLLQLRPAQPRAAPLPGEFTLPPIPPPSTAPHRDERRLRVDHVVFKGNQAISSTELEQIATPYVGKPITVGDIEDLRQKISRHYVARGFINSGALLGDDAFVAGTLTYDIVEGRLSEIRVNGQERLWPGYLTQRLGHDPDTPFNIERLREHFVLLLNDPLFERMNARISPGPHSGEAMLDIDVVRARPYNFSVHLNNYRPPSIGEKSIELSGWVRNLTGFGDVLDVSQQRSASGSHGARTNLAWQMPLNTLGTFLSFKSENGLSSVIEEPMRNLEIESQVSNKTVGVSHVFIESLQHKLTLGIDRQDRTNRTFLLGEPFSFISGEPGGVTRVSALRFWQEYAYRTETTVLALRSTLVGARNNLQEITAPPANHTVQPAHAYRFWLLQAQYVQQIGTEGARVLLRGTLQQTAQKLLPIDGLSIGGINTVRGFRENQLIRDQGAIFNLEFEYPLIKGTSSDLQASLIPFYDTGTGRNLGGTDDTLKSTGLATRCRWNGFSLDLAVAKRLTNTSTAASARETLQDRGIHFQLGYSFF